MTAFQLRQATKDLQHDSEVIFVTEKGEILDFIKVEHECGTQHDDAKGKEVACYPLKLVITLKGPAIQITEKKAGYKAEDWRSGA